MLKEYAREWNRDVLHPLLLTLSFAQVKKHTLTSRELSLFDGAKTIPPGNLSGSFILNIRTNRGK